MWDVLGAIALCSMAFLNFASFTLVEVSMVLEN